MSSLNMPPEPLKGADPDASYLADTDRWAHHAMEHLFAATHNLNRAHRVHDDLRDLVRRIAMLIPKDHPARPLIDEFHAQERARFRALFPDLCADASDDADGPEDAPEDAPRPPGM